ncbi:hypothetical protein DACRYDRAFT_97396 [Dacryopinax primogenitus]|uniref:Uncharacterized protein n=1 Tax=Dacryopinax primogenitus (strain DJM 731) TaxID=1858805 RepID=M5FPC5_DACPD|nr:uncharacterized protein DACRYDRAFT_97396 [Dacryopinax primogenitus]EJT96968.1 hypothetical protein DACRYDRAFT_97396 [Dacryopinax primogenitus]
MFCAWASYSPPQRLLAYTQWRCRNIRTTRKSPVEVRRVPSMGQRLGRPVRARQRRWYLITNLHKARERGPLRRARGKSYKVSARMPVQLSGSQPGEPTQYRAWKDTLACRSRSTIKLPVSYIRPILPMIRPWGGIAT